MSKKKNTLKDLDEFLKQQAASLVTPEPVRANAPSVPEAEPAQAPASPEISTESILRDLKRLAEQEPAAFRDKLYNIVIKALEAQPPFVAEDKMLINTALYLKSGDQWKDAIRAYWSNQS